MENYDRFDNINIFLERDKPYFGGGRTQTEEESDQISEELKTFLAYYDEDYITMKGNEETPYAILKEIENVR